MFAAIRVALLMLKAILILISIFGEEVFFLFQFTHH